MIGIALEKPHLSAVVAPPARAVSLVDAAAAAADRDERCRERGLPKPALALQCHDGGRWPACQHTQQLVEYRVARSEIRGKRRGRQRARRGGGGAAVGRVGRASVLEPTSDHVHGQLLRFHL